MRLRRMLGEARESATVGVARLGVGLPVRASIVGGMVVALVASYGAAGVPPWVVTAVFLTAAMATAARADTHVGLAVLLAFGLYWLVHVDTRASVWSVLGAAGLLVFHLATSAATLVPAEGDVPRSLVLRWARWAAPVLGGSAVLWGVTALLTRAEAGANVVLTVVAVLALATGGWVALARSGPPTQ